MLEDDLKFQSEGDRLFDEGKFSNAETAYRSVKDFFMREWNLGVMHYSIGEDEKALDCFIRLREKADEKDLPSLRYASAKALYGLGNYERAKTNLEGVLKSDLSHDIKKDTKRMLKRMRFEILNKIFGRVKKSVLSNPFNTSIAVLLGSFFAYGSRYEHSINHLDDNVVSLPLTAFTLSFGFLSAMSQRFVRQKMKGVKLDSLLKDGVADDSGFVFDALKEIKNTALYKMQPLTAYSLFTFLGSHSVGVTAGILDFIGKHLWNKYRKKIDKVSFNLPCLERLSNYSIPIGIASLPIGGFAMRCFGFKPIQGLWYLPYLTHLAFRSLPEKDLFSKESNISGWISNRVNKLSLVGCLLAAGAVGGLQIYQLRDKLSGNLADISHILSYFSPYDINGFLGIMMISAFMLKRALISVADQEFKFKRRGSLKDILMKPLLYYPVTAGILSGAYGMIRCANQSGFSDFTELDVNQNLYSFFIYSAPGFLGGVALGRALREIRNLPDYFKLYMNKIKGNLDGAIESYRGIVAKPCGRAVKKSRLLNLGDMLAANGRLEDAFLELNRVNSVETKDIGFFRRIFELFYKANISEKQDVQSVRRAAILLSGSGKKQEAKIKWQKCVELEDTLLNRCMCAEFLSKNGFKEAQDEWREILLLIGYQSPEVEGLDSTHVVRHVRGKFLDYVLKFGNQDELNSELDITKRLSDAVRNHPEFVAPDPLTVFEDNKEWILATKYLKHERLNLSDISQLKKVIEYMHLIYRLGIKQTRRDDIKITESRVKTFSVDSDSSFANLAKLVIELAKPYFNTVFVTHTDSDHLNWGLIRDGRKSNAVFRFDVEGRGEWHPFMDLSCLLLFSDVGYKQKLIEYFVDSFPKNERKILRSQGPVGYNALSLLRGVQIIPTLIPKMKKRWGDIEAVIKAMNSSLEVLKDFSLTKVNADKSALYLEDVKQIIPYG